MGVARRGALVAAAAMALAAPVAAAQEPAAPAPAAPAAALTRVEIPSSVTVGHPITVRGRVTPAAGTLSLDYSPDGGTTWRSLGQNAPTAAGRFGLRAPLPGPGSVRVSLIAADGSVLAGEARYVRIVRPVDFTVKVMATENISGLPFTARGAVPGAARGEKAVIEGSVNGGRYRAIRRVAITRGRVSATFTPPSGGRWRFRLVAPARPGVDSGGSMASQSIQVFAKNPHRVPASAPHYLVQVIHETQLYYYQRGQLVRVLPVVFGKPSTPTPIGRFAVYSKTAGPGPAFGPLVLWYYRGYGIHGTNQEYLLSRSWRYYSHGCTRNYNDNIRWLWPQVPVGTPVINLR
ncbi:MAG: L,D-transpeptidase [Thermoleophilia bacterium]